MDYNDVLHFWFEEITPDDWWKKDAAFDAEICDRFLRVHEAAAAGELFEWRKKAKGGLAEIIVLDQFSRNMFRDKPEAFAYDGQALILAQEAVAHGVGKELNAAERKFLYSPYMHSESERIHEVAMDLYSGDAELADTLKYEKMHKEIIDRFGRYPHRNEVLGRESTSEEIEFLKQPGSSF